MAALHRLQWIDAEIRAGRYPNARRLAETFEISHRQAQRDFEYLRDSLGAPLAYEARRKGYRYEGDAFVLPGQFVSAREQTVLGSLAEYYARSAGPHGSDALGEMAALFARLSGRERGEFSRPSDSVAPVGMPFLAALSLPDPIWPPGATRMGSVVPPELVPHYRGHETQNRIVCEFHDAGAFVSLLLTAGLPFRVERPAWLRERLAARVEALRAANEPGTTRCVVEPPVTSPHPKNRSEAMKQTEARLAMSWTTFVGAAEGVLRAAGLVEPSTDTSTFMGLSGRAFHLAMDDRCWAGCPTMYDWQRQHVVGLERAGVFAEAFFAAPGARSYDAARRRAVDHIKASIDRGIGVVLWGVDVPEFGVVYGYDDADGVFLVDGVGRMNTGASTPILYENVGRSSDVPELHYVVPIERVPWDAAAALRATLADYVERTEDRFGFMAKYVNGLHAYDNWLGALESGAYEPFGLRYNTAIYADAKAHAAAYLERVAGDGVGLPGLRDVATAARENAGLFKAMLDALWPKGAGPGEYLGAPVTAEQASALRPLVREARGVEVRQLEATKRALAG